MKNLTIRFAFAAFFLSLFTFGMSQNADGTKDGNTVEADPADATAMPTTKISFSETAYDFGEITQGTTVKHTFTFTNIGENPLKLENVKPSCGCTAMDWPREEIAPGESAEITAQFNSSGKSGKQMKYITITYNGEPNIERISFQGNVVVPTPDPDVKSEETGLEQK